MQRNQLLTCLIVAAAVAAVVVIIAGVPLAALLPFALLLACTLMMIFMMRGMSGMAGREDHTGHGCEHDQTRHADRPGEPQR